MTRALGYKSRPGAWGQGRGLPQVATGLPKTSVTSGGKPFNRNGSVPSSVRGSERAG